MDLKARKYLPFEHFDVDLLFKEMPVFKECADIQISLSKERAYAKAEAEGRAKTDTRVIINMYYNYNYNYNAEKIAEMLTLNLEYVKNIIKQNEVNAYSK